MEDYPEELRGLRYTNDPRVRRILVREVQRRLKKTPGQVVDTIFEDCLTEEDFAGRAAEWCEAFDPPMTPEELKEWAMKRRGLSR